MKSQKEPGKSIKAIFTDPHIPQQIDVTSVVMDQIKQNKEGFFVKYKVSILVALGLLASITTGYAAMQYYQLKNPQGEVLYQEKDISEYRGKIDKGSDSEMDALYGKRWKIEDSMEPGTAAAVYIVENNPKKMVFTIGAPLRYTTLGEVHKKVGEELFLPETLPGGFTFLDARLENEIKQEYDKEVLYKKAEKEKKDIVMQPLEWTDELNYINVTYKAEDSFLDLIISNYEGIDGNTIYVQGLDSQKKEVIKVGQIEVLYKEDMRKDRVRKQMIWVTENSGKRLQYRVQADGNKLNLENVSQFLNAFLSSKN